MPDVTLLDADGVARAVPESEVQYRLDRGWSRDSAEQKTDRLVAESQENVYGGVAGTALATGAGVARSVTGGISDAVLSAAGAGGTLDKLRKHNPIASTVGEIGGAVIPVGAGGLAARAGTKAAGLVKGTGTLAQVGRSAVAAGTEGAILGVGQGVTELSLSKDPLTLERAASVIGSNVLFGAGTGAAIGAAGKLAEKGLGRAKQKLDDIASKPQVADDGARAAVADEIKAFRNEVKESKIWLATKDADVKTIREVREVGKIALEADRAVDRMLRNPKALAKRPERVLDGLQQQEHALETLINQGDKLRPIFAADTSGTRAAALDFATTALEKNRALQAKITQITAKPAAAAQGGLGDAIQDAGMGYMLGAAAGIPGLGTALAAGRVGMGLVKKLGADTAAVAARGSKAIDTFLTVGAKVAPTARLMATKTLTNAAYGATKDEPTRTPRLADAFKARSSEIRNLTAPGPDGKPVMRMEARQQIADRLAPIRAADPVLADKIETNKAKAIEFLADKLPRKPDLPGMISDKWQPSDMEMRTWARHVAAVEDPHSVIDRLADCSVTAEDAETMRAVYPEMYAEIQAQIMMQLGELRSNLPYARRLALSIFSDIPVDPALDPRVLAVLQESYANEEGTDGGATAPKAAPQFGSITKPQPTAAQER